MTITVAYQCDGKIVVMEKGADVSPKDAKRQAVLPVGITLPAGAVVGVVCGMVLISRLYLPFPFSSNRLTFCSEASDVGMYVFLRLQPSAPGEC